MRTAVSAWCVEICSFEWTRGIAKTELQAVQGPEADLPPGVAGSGGASSSSDTAPPAAPGSRDAGGGGVAEAVPDAVPGSRAADGEEPASCDSRTALGPLSVLYEPRRPGTGTVIATGPAGTARWTPRGSHIEYAGPAPLPGFIESGRGTGRVCSGKCTKEKPYPTDVLQISDTISAADADARSQCAHQRSQAATASTVANSHSGSLVAAQEADEDAVGVSSQVCKADARSEGPSQDDSSLPVRFRQVQGLWIQRRVMEARVYTIGGGTFAIWSVASTALAGWLFERAASWSLRMPSSFRFVLLSDGAIGRPDISITYEGPARSKPLSWLSRFAPSVEIQVSIRAPTEEESGLKEFGWRPLRNWKTLCKKLRRCFFLVPTQDADGGFGDAAQVD
jgi:hypothetical protein